MEVSELLELIPIEDYVAQYVDGFEARGGELWCTSPFNPHERTPSFSVRPEANVFYDFSAGVGGNLIDFITRYHDVSVYRAVQLAKEFADIKEGEEPTCSRLEATRVARRYRYRAKQSAQSTSKTLSPHYMDHYEFRREKLQAWADEGIPWDVMLARGVRYDAFDDRIVYPIRDADGNIISVCGRTCDPHYKEKRIRKYTYFQSIGTIDALYGFSDCKQDILDAREVVIFEGAKSCMKAEGWGIRNTGALLTSHLSTNQLHFLIRLSSFHGVRMVFALDSDVDITKDENILRLMRYARVEWVQNRDGLLDDKDSPADKGEEVFRTLYQKRKVMN